VPPRLRLVRLASAALAAGFALAAGGRAEAYVQYRGSNGAPWSWPGTTCLPIVAYPHAFTSMPIEEVSAAAMNAAAAWSAGGTTCTFLDLEMTLSTDPGPVAIPVSHGSVVFRTDQWCWLLDDGTCSTKPEDQATHQSNTLMLTTLATNTRTGEIVMAATEVNAVDVTWADLALHPDLQTAQASVHDLQNALTHELGHFIGLDHNCVVGDPQPWPIDNLGQPAPSCLGAPTSITEATMYYESQPGDLDKRTLAADDKLALCDIYPVSHSPGRCVPPDGKVHHPATGCACGVGPAPGAAGLVTSGLGLAMLAWLVVARRATRASRRDRPFC
jgi:MYXO-CTERM domain-containing protein